MTSGLAIFAVHRHRDFAGNSGDWHDGDGVVLTSTNGVPNKPSSSLLRAYTTASYDDQGRTYSSSVFSVDQSVGTISTNSLTTRVWFDHRGDQIAQSDPGGLFTKSQFDGVGREVRTFTTDGAGGSSWAQASSVTGDNVLQQDETQYDSNCNAILTITRQRFDNETATGALGDPNTTPKARVYYAASCEEARPGGRRGRPRQPPLGEEGYFPQFYAAIEDT